MEKAGEKRCSSQQPPNPPKRSKVLEDQEETEEEVEEESEDDEGEVPEYKLRPGEKDYVSGTINKLYVTNFMCHTSMEISFNRRVNFIVGRNGSGKSAIIAALVLGLGGSAGTTNRGTSVRDFIKKGRHTSTIEITLNNDGINPYNPMTYGDHIIVIRTLKSSGSSTYKIKNSSGRIMSQRKCELEKILRGLNIQVDNPISVLNQDMSRTFLRNSTPSENFKLFRRGTMLDFVLKMHDGLEESKAVALDDLEKKVEILGIVERELENVKNKWKMLENANNLGLTIIDLENEMYWAQAIQEEMTLKTLQKELASYKKSNLIAKRKIDDWNDEVDSSQAEEQTLLSNIHEFEAKLATEEPNLNEINKLHSTKEKLLKSKMKEYDSLKKNYDEQLNIEEKVKKAIENIEEKSSEEHKTEKAQRDAKIKSYKEKLEQIDALLASNDQSLKQFQGFQTHCLEEEDTLQVEHDEISAKCGKIQQKLQELSGKSSTALTIFGAKVPIVLQVVEDDFKKGLFVKKPIGPIGAYVKVTDSSWAPAIESYLGSTFLHSFCCHCKSDMMQLNKILCQVLGKSAKPALYTSKFLDNVHDVRKGEVRIDGYSNMLDLLDVSNVVVMNCLIDNKKLEKILLVKDYKEARHYTVDIKNVPVNCKVALTRDGDQYMPDPNYRSYSGNGSTKCHYIQVTTEDAIKNLNDEWERWKLTKESVVQQLRTLKERKRANEQELSQTKDMLYKLRRSCTELTHQLNILKHDEPECQSVAALLVDLKDLREKLSVLKVRIDDCENLKNTLEQEVCDLAGKLSDQQNKCDALRKKYIAKKSKLNQVEIHLKSLTVDPCYVVTYKDQEKKIAKLENDIVIQKTVIDKATVDANQICTRIVTDRLPNIIQEELEKLRTQVAHIESHCGNIEDVGSKYIEKTRRCRITKAEVNNVKEVLKSMDEMLADRQELYSSSEKHAGLIVQLTFLRILLLRDFKGQIKLNYKGETLEVEMHGGDIETKCLSGGERSYSTVAFIAALWEAVDPPFYVLDEFDVFMDKVNRGVILDLLLARAQSKRFHQFMFITPQDTANVFASDDVTIFRMSDPRPS